MRLRRDRPEPLSTSGKSLASKRSSHQRRSTAREASAEARLTGVADVAEVAAVALTALTALLGAAKLSVKNSCCAITLLLYLLMSRMISANGAELSSKLGSSGDSPAAEDPLTVMAGTRPSRTAPSRRPPISRQRPSTARSAKLFGSA